MPGVILALVAGFAEGRNEIDGEFIDTVVAAQGGSLEGQQDQEALASGDLAAMPGVSKSALPASDDGLEATMRDTWRRGLTRLEGLPVLEMNSLLMPALTDILGKLRPPEKPSLLPEYGNDPLAVTEEIPRLASAATNPNRWWSKLRAKRK